MSDVMTFSKRTAAGLEEVLRTLLLDSENKVPAERLRIVGALSAGAIIESGSNANGEYTRFASGLQICFATVDVTVGISPNNSGVGGSTAWQWTFPAQFYTTANLVAMSGGWYKGGAGEGWLQVTANSNSSAVGRIYGMNAVSEQAITVQLCAIGRWKA